MTTETKALVPWVIVSPDRLVYIGLHTTDYEAWDACVGNYSHAILRLKDDGWYAAPATVEWTKPGRKRKPMNAYG